jgi:hypothetical protein
LAATRAPPPPLSSRASAAIEPPLVAAAVELWSTSVMPKRGLDGESRALESA